MNSALCPSALMHGPLRLEYTVECPAGLLKAHYHMDCLSAATYVLIGPCLHKPGPSL